MDLFSIDEDLVLLMLFLEKEEVVLGPNPPTE